MPPPPVGSGSAGGFGLEVDAPSLSGPGRLSFGLRRSGVPVRLFVRSGGRVTRTWCSGAVSPSGAWYGFEDVFGSPGSDGPLVILLGAARHVRGPGAV